MAVEQIFKFMVSALLSLFSVRAVLAFSHRFRIFDDAAKRLEESDRKLHSGNIPRLGGLAIFACFTMVALVFSPWDFMQGGFVLSFLGVSSIIFGLGLWDDLKACSAKLRLAGQILAAVLAIAVFDLEVASLHVPPFSPIALPEALGWTLGIFIIVGAINALNMIDGLDGLAVGIFAISLVLLSYILLISQARNPALVALSVPVLGIVLGFLRYNSHPAKIFLGDAGTYWLGFTIGFMMLVVLKESLPSAAGSRPVPLLALILCFSVPILDSAAVIAARLIKGINPLKADSRHLHHALMRIGLSQSQCVATLYFLSFAIGILGILPAIYPSYELWWLYYACLALLAGFIIFSRKIDRDLIQSLISYKRTTSRRYSVLVRVIIRLLDGSIRASIYLILLFAPILSGRVSRELAVFACVALGALLGLKLFRRETYDQLSLAVAAMGISIVLVAINQTPLTVTFLGQQHVIQYLYNYLFLYLFAAALLYLLLTFKRRYLLVHLVDFILIGVPLLLLLLPEETVRLYRLNIVSLRALVILPIVSLLSKKSRYNYEKIELVTIFSLLLLVLIGLFGMRVVIQ